MFDRVQIISLKRRQDRLVNFKRLQAEQGWRLPEPQVFEAIEGDKIGVPAYFTQGGGAYGCLRSHVTCLERAIMDDVGTLLMLEDDLTWQADAWDRLEAFMKVVPPDYDMLMLGGQHHRPARPCGIDGVVRVANCQRTHAYVIKGVEPMKSLLKLWTTCEVHIDWRLGDWQRDWKVYAPDSFIFAQAGGKSDISGRTNPAYTWSEGRQPKSKTHLLVLRSPRSVVDNMTGFHRGYYLHSSGIDNGLLEVCTSEDRKAKLAEWITLVGREAERAGGVPCIWCDAISKEEVALATKREVVLIEATSLDDLKKQWGAL